MADDAVAFFKAEDVKKAESVLKGLVGLLKTVRGRTGFGLDATKRTTAVKVGPEFRASAAHIADEIHKTILLFVQKFALPDTEESVIKRGGILVITAFNDLNDLENYYKEIANTGRLPSAPFWKFWGRDISRFNDAKRIDAPFIKLIEDTEQARTGTRPSENKLAFMLKKIF